MDLSVRRIAVFAACLALACWVVFGLAINQSAWGYVSQPLPTVQSRKAGDHAPQPRYVMTSGWNGCGGLPFKGWEGCTSQSGAVLKCVDGTIVYSVRDHCTSPDAAATEQLTVLGGVRSISPNWKIIRTTLMGGGLLVELAEPIQVLPEAGATSLCVYLWTEGPTLRSIYGPDREHVLEYFENRHKYDRGD